MFTDIVPPLRVSMLAAVVSLACLAPTTTMAQADDLTFQQAQIRTSYARKQMEAKRRAVTNAEAREKKAISRQKELKQQYEAAVKEAKEATQARQDAEKSFEEARENWSREADRLIKIYESRKPAPAN
ncbi:MAG: hypothetical protein PVH25_14015 [Burkholderiales bacterium]|jgi:hypothetical protein